MPKIYFHSRDELTVINTDLLAAAVADGNYTKIAYITKKEFTVTIGISKVENHIKESTDKEHKFVRLGRSVIVNHSFLQKIDMQKQIIVLSDGSTNELRVKVPKTILKPYKEAIERSIKKPV